MLFLVERTSNPYEQPCEEAIKMDCGQKLGERWCVDLPTLSHLLLFELKYGDLILSIANNRYTIEIYDDHRE